MSTPSSTGGSKRSTASAAAPASSAAASKDPSSSSAPQHITPTTQPISRPSTAVGRSYTHIHPVLVLLHFAQRFPSLVADPEAALLRDLGVLALAQTAYAVICLPPTTASQSSRSDNDGKDRSGPAPSRRPGGSSGVGSGGAKSRSKSDASLATRVSTALLALLLAFGAATPVTFVLLVLLGGPLTTDHAATLLCAAHLALLATPPLFYTRGVNPRAWREVAALLLPGDAVWGGALGAAVGAWLGAVPIPLDWDRAWQRWPVTIVAGAYAGWALGRFLGEFVFWGKRVPMNTD